MYSTYEVANAMTVLATQDRGEAYWRAHDTMTWAEKHMTLAEQTRIGDYARELMLHA